MVILTYDLRTQVKQLKMKLKDKLYIENMTFESFQILAAQFIKSKIYISFLNLCP